MTKTEAKPPASADDLLKAAVAGKADPTAAGLAAKVRAAAARLRGDRHVLGAAAAALALGAALGAGVTARAIPGDRDPAAAALAAGLDAGRSETARLGADIERLQQMVADLRAVTEAARKEAAGRSGSVTERLAQLDRSVATKLAALGERFDQAEREQSARIATLAPRPAPAAPKADAKLDVRAEPVQTGSLADAKEPKPEGKLADVKAKPSAPEKPPVIDGWAVRDVFDGTAVIENRRRRLVEVAPGDTVPGIGRVEAVERQGRAWVVVTRQGIVTAQPW